MFINSYDKVERPQDVDGQPFKIGAQIVVKAGAIDDRRRRRRCSTATIVAVDADFGTRRHHPRHPRATTLGHKLMRNRKVRVFKKQTVSDAVKRSAGERAPAEVSSQRRSAWTGSSRTTRPTGTSSGGWRAGIGFWLLIDGQTAHFVEAGRLTRRPIELDVAGHDRRPSTRGSPACSRSKTVTARAWDPKAKKAVSSRAGARTGAAAEIGLTRKKVSDDLGGGSDPHLRLVRHDQGEVEELAQATLDRMANAYVEAEAHVPGNPEDQGRCRRSKINGVGQQFSGKYLVGTVRHTCCGRRRVRDAFVSTATATPSSLAAMTGRQRRDARSSATQLVDRDRHQQQRPGEHGPRAR